MNLPISAPCIMVIFGGTGDLTSRKLMPALYQRFLQNILPADFAVVAVGRRDLSDSEYRSRLFNEAQKYVHVKIDTEKWAIFIERVYYFKCNFEEVTRYDGLKAYLLEMDDRHKTQGNRIFYLSVAPQYFEIITRNIQGNNMAPNLASWQRLMIEKPFGSDLSTAQYLNSVITDVFTEKNTFRIDHYLGKEMLQNLMVIRFGNAVFESIWNSKHIDNIQITFHETVGAEGRGGYYDKAGALKDMFQNHILQLLALVAMEPPVNLKTESIRNEKVKLLSTLEPMTADHVKENCVRGQYGQGIVFTDADTDSVADTSASAILPYRQEQGVSETSNTETYFAMRLFIKNFRWGNTPFYIRTGKRMPEKATYIIIEFKSMPEFLFFKEYNGMAPNLLVIKIQPDEGVSFQFNAKKPGTINEIENVNMEFCQNCRYGANSPEAYERLITDVLRDDPTLFTRWDEIENSWRFVDSITDAWKSQTPEFPNYEPRTYGPIDAAMLPVKDGRKWWNFAEEEGVVKLE
jgi:glucose-6-phosphate 1-dehydrogenase